MSRASDSSSSGPQGRGGAAYPAGGDQPSDGAAPAAKPERKTETTMTTRIRINIPGSRPIPPVVVRKPVGDETSTEPEAQAPAAPAPAPAPAPERKEGLPTRPKPAPGQARPSAQAAAAAGKDGGTGSSDWFAPRKSAPAGSSTPKQPLPRRGAARGAYAPGGTGQTAPGAPGDVFTPGGAGAPGGAVPGAPGAPGGAAPYGGAAGTPGAPGVAADGFAPGAGVHGGAPGAPSAGDAFASGGAYGAGGAGAPGGAPVGGDPFAPNGGPAGAGAGFASGGVPQGGAPLSSNAGPAGAGGGKRSRGGAPKAGAPNGGAPKAGPVGSGAPGTGFVPGGNAAQGGDPFASNAGSAGHGGAPKAGPVGSGAPGAGFVPGPNAAQGGDPFAPNAGSAGHGAQGGDPFAPNAGSAGHGGAWPADNSTTGAMPHPPVSGDAPWPGNPPKAKGNGGRWERVETVPRGGASASTTQQFPAPAPGRTDTPHDGVPVVPPPAAKNNKGKKKGPKTAAPAAETLVSGGVPPVTKVPPPPADSGAPRVPVPKPKPVPPPAGAPAGAPAKAAPAPAKGKGKGKAAKAKKKGRSKLVLLGGGVIGLVAAAYAAGLLLDHADVPNGTTVLGVDIGGKSKEQAVQKLDSALGGRATAPLKVTVGGKTAELKPEVAGLSIDTQETVRAAAGRDYNPVTVIGSLIGRTHAAEPTVVADEEKIAAALKSLAGSTGTVKEGTVKFESGKAVAVYGQPYEGLDVDKSVDLVSKAYRDRAATGKDQPVSLPSSSQQPKVSKAEVDRAMKEFAEPAMSGLVTVQTDPAHKIQFGPEHSLPKILSMKEVNGKLVENYDLDALKQLYGNAFNGVLIQRGDGTKKPVLPQDVANALGKALRGRTPAERVGVIPLS
ncbi:hypothetical protein GCM10010218_47060 [Streptomyces mashuensis]|uniref:Peptidoglycan binding domain-containing protein n=1 Tax=Streptomyces mashuensis TaxID=33904 RepID=A0A919B6F8_9ACTN|nr:hypothetical protein [Streptomyces mashuensis]GHF60255.1 hypothetical protein GCM10010218_47060 [Streptomyces mashuensis]